MVTVPFVQTLLIGQAPVCAYSNTCLVFCRSLVLSQVLYICAVCAFYFCFGYFNLSAFIYVSLYISNRQRKEYLLPCHVQIPVVCCTLHTTKALFIRIPDQGSSFSRKIYLSQTYKRGSLLISD